jgi:aryl-alcohol dehydrogenase-like predicted oxidoreductase
MSSKPVRTSSLGKNGPQVPALGYGLMGLSRNVYGAFPSDDERFAILDRAHELGSVFWDSSELVFEVI